MERVSQADLAAYLGCHYRTIAVWESGNSGPSRDAAVRLEEVIGIPARSWSEPLDRDALASLLVGLSRASQAFGKEAA